MQIDCSLTCAVVRPIQAVRGNGTHDRHVASPLQYLGPIKEECAAILDAKLYNK